MLWKETKRGLWITVYQSDASQFSKSDVMGLSFFSKGNIMRPTASKCMTECVRLHLFLYIGDLFDAGE